MPGVVTAAESAYQHAKELILTGQLDGDLISEATVADSLGLSRTPVREAFVRLQAEGFMQLYPKRGALVLPVPAHEGRELLEARLLVENNAINTACGLPAPAVEALVTRLREVVKAQHAASEPQEFARLDALFHTAIVEAAGNRLLSGFYSTLRDRQRRMVATAVHTRTNLSELVDHHESIATAIEARDADVARERLSHHLHSTYEALL